MYITYSHIVSRVFRYDGGNGAFPSPSTRSDLSSACVKLWMQKKVITRAVLYRSSVGVYLPRHLGRKAFHRDPHPLR